MKKSLLLFTALIAFYFSQAQASDTSIHTAAVAVCDCLGKANISDQTSQEQMQQIFLNCVIKSAPELMTQIAASGEDYATAGQEIATKLAMEMLKTGCPAFSKIATAMAMNGGGDMGMQMQATPRVEAVESTDGVVTKIEEKDFTYITVKTTAGRELNFIYFNYVPGSDEWIKDPATKLKNKNVSLSYVETEVYQPKFKQFMNVKEIKTLTIK